MQAPESVLKAFYEGRMTPEDGAAFRADVEAGRVSVPSWFKMEPLTEEPAPPPVVEDAPPVTAESPIEDQQAALSLDPAMASAPEQPVMTGSGTMTDQQFMAPDTSATFEELAQRPSLKDEVMGFFDKAKKAYTGEGKIVASTEAMRDWQEATTGNILDDLHVAWSTMATNPEETADILVNKMGEGASWTPDEKGNPIITNPQGEQFAVKPGARWNDMLRFVGTVAKDLLLTKGAGVLGAAASAGKYGKRVKQASDIVSKTGTRRAALEGGLLELEDEFAQMTAGGTVDPSAVLTGSLADVGVKKAGDLFKTSPSKYDHAIEMAEKGHPRAKQLLMDAHSVDPEGLDVALDTAGFSKFDPNLGGTVKGRGLEDAFKDVVDRDNMGRAAKEISQHLKVDQDVVNHLVDNNLLNKANLQYVIDQGDKETKKLVDSLSLGDDSLETQAFFGKSKFSKEIQKNLEGIGADKDIGKNAASVRKTMDEAHETMYAEEKVAFDELGAMIEEAYKDKKITKTVYEEDPITKIKKPKQTETKFSSRPNNVLKHLEEKITANTPVNQRGGSLDASKLDGFDRQVYLALKGGDVDFKMLNEWRKKAGDLMSPSAVPDKDYRNASELYNLIKQDQLDIVKDIDPEGLGIGDAWKKANAMTESRKAYEGDMTQLFGKRLDKEMTGQFDQAISEAKRGGAGKFKRMINAVPEEMRKEVAINAMYRSMGDRLGDLEPEKFGQFWNKFKSNSEAYGFLKETIGKDFELFEAYGAISEQLTKASKKAPGITKDDVTDIMYSRKTLVSNFMREMGMYGVGSALLTPFSAVGGATTGMGLAILSGLRQMHRYGTEAKKKDLLDFLKSKKFLNVVANPTSELGIKELSRTKQAMRFAKMYGVGTKPSEIERWISASLRADQKDLTGETTDGQY